MEEDVPKPLDGVRILDMTAVVMGPYATQILGDMGADIIKVEPPQGDTMRRVGPMRHPDMGHMYLNSNHSKRSIALDLKQPQGRDALLRLAATVDVLVYNVRPKAMARLGLSYEDVRAVNDKIIYVGLVGYGQNGPYAEKPAYDDLMQGAAGMGSLMARSGSSAPRYVPLTLADRAVGLHGVIAITGALYYRANTGQGQEVQVPMFETMASMVLADHMAGATFDPPMGPTGYQRLLSPDRRPFQTRDGYVCVLIYTDAHWERFFQAIGRGEVFRDDARFTTMGARAENIDAVYKTVSDIMLTRTSREWLDLFEKADIPVTPMHTIESLMEDPHLRAVGLVEAVQHPTEGAIRTVGAPATWSASQPAPSRPAPRIGQHSAEILREAGYSAGEIAALVAQGALVDGAAT
jgi:crotonobetainyl-CoA:carnitine CoA-transferase CaiB-like acyl-CoA transferase